LIYNIMANFDPQCVAQTDTILTALERLDKVSGTMLILFVTNEQKQVVGTLTDGDIRRALLRGLQLDTPIIKVMKSDFSYLSVEEKDHTAAISRLRDRGIYIIPLLDKEHHIVDIYNLKKIQSVLPIDAVLMAGGKGERLRPLTEKTPKPLLPVGDKAIIDHNIDRLISYGINHISVTVNYLKEQLEDHFAEPRNGVKINCCREPKFLGTIGSIKYIDTFHNDTVLLMNSDLFTNIDYEGFYLHFKTNDADMSVVAVPYSVSVPYGIFVLDGRNINGVLEKPTYNYFANAGIYLMKREMLDLIPENTFFNATDLIDKAVAINKKVIRFPLNGTWIDIGNAQEYQKANELVKHLK